MELEGTHEISRPCHWGDIKWTSYDGIRFAICKNCGHGQMEYRSSVQAHLRNQKAAFEALSKTKALAGQKGAMLSLERITKEK